MNSWSGGLSLRDAYALRNRSSPTIPTGPFVSRLMMQPIFSMKIQNRSYPRSERVSSVGKN